MKNHIIYLPNYQRSCDMAQHALTTAVAQGWDIELWPGVDGATVSARDLSREYGIRICSDSKKCWSLMTERAGVRGCFMSHWQLWHQCRDTNEITGIFEHDVEFLAAPPRPWPDFTHVLRLQGRDLKPARPAGTWYEGARAYMITPAGARRLIEWVHSNGCLPADVVQGTDVIDIDFLPQDIMGLQIVHDSKHSKHTNSFTWNLEGMRDDS